ncbi:MAG: hypothetical protein PVI90_00080 [Desulfobacteraceae bacterium]
MPLARPAAAGPSSGIPPSAAEVTSEISDGSRAILLKSAYAVFEPIS